ncbi:MAG: hypothetical protein IKK33_04045 [Lachnospiraceae bacterium]|nr:hypothetical protein [Lachnospiraceae bacterium]
MYTALSTVYNHYLTTYAPKGTTRYDAHKKSDLKGVYNSIVKLNRESPWYLPATGKDVQHYAIDLKENARNLHNTIASLGGLDDSQLLSKKTAFTTNDEIISATFVGSYTPGMASPTFTMEVRELATPQENMGRFLDKGKISLPPDTYSFDVAINDMNYEFQFTINESETNQSVQERLSRLINSSGVGLKARTLETEGRTSLLIRSESTGLPENQKQIFSITDTHTSKSRGAVEYFGLDYISHEASNARFLVNGEERTSTSNEFTIGRMFDVALHSTSPEGIPVTIGLKNDIESLTDNVLQLANGYNEFIKATSSYLASQPRSRNAIKEISGIATQFSNSFQGIGVNLTEEGTIEINMSDLGKSIASDEDIADTFGTLKQFSNHLIQKSEEISLNPMNYVEKKIVAYKNPGRSFANPYVTSAYSGMMFNGYC